MQCVLFLVPSTEPHSRQIREVRHVSLMIVCSALLLRSIIFWPIVPRGLGWPHHGTVPCEAPKQFLHHAEEKKEA